MPTISRQDFEAHVDPSVGSVPLVNRGPTNWIACSSRGVSCCALFGGAGSAGGRLRLLQLCQLRKEISCPSIISGRRSRVISVLSLGRSFSPWLRVRTLPLA
jgi:hypothetical protein